MKKKTDEELGILLTREISAMMFDTRLSAEQKVKLFCSIVGGEEIDDPLLGSYADTLRTGFEHSNNARKAAIYSKRSRDKECARHRRVSSPIVNDRRVSLPISGDRCQSLYNGNGNGNGNDIPPKSPLRGTEGKIPPALSAEDITGETERIREIAVEAAADLESMEAFAHMRVNRKKLIACLISILKKNGGAAKANETLSNINCSLNAWTAAWKDDDWRFCPGRITDWLYDGKYLEEPRKKDAAPSVGAGCGTCGVEVG